MGRYFRKLAVNLHAKYIIDLGVRRMRQEAT